MNERVKRSLTLFQLWEESLTDLNIVEKAFVFGIIRNAFKNAVERIKKEKMEENENGKMDRDQFR